jgi:3-hydroxy-9,10-secoandrosta-1,3,5(10)-triene-9,17-dione monooxygenase
VDAARELHRRAIADILKKAEQGDVFTPLVRARYMRDKTFVAKLCVQAVNRLFDAGGGSAILETSALQRFHRDVHAASHHQGINWDAAAENFGRQTLGLEPSPGRYGLA